MQQDSMNKIIEDTKTKKKETQKEQTTRDQNKGKAIKIRLC